MPTNLSETELARARDIFSRYDHDCNGVLDRSEFSILLKSLDVQLTPEEIAAEINALDENRNGKIDFDEFVAWWSNR